MHYLRGSRQVSVSKGDADQDLQHDADQDEAGDRNKPASVCMPHGEPVYQDAGKQDQPGRQPVHVIHESHPGQPFAAGQTAVVFDEGIDAFADLRAEKKLDRRDRQ